MTRKDYILIAEAIRVPNYHDTAEILEAEEDDKDFACGVGEGIDKVTAALCDAFERDNPRFNREHFLAVVRGEKALESRPARR
jgi:hypothetical protein